MIMTRMKIEMRLTSICKVFPVSWSINCKTTGYYTSHSWIESFYVTTNASRFATSNCDLTKLER